MKSSLLILLILASTACTPTKTAEVSNGKINRSAPYYWDVSGALPLKVSDDFSFNEKANITAMSDAWSAAVANKRVFFNLSSTDEVSSSSLNLDNLGDDGILGIYRITHWPKSLPTSALAVTQLFGERFDAGSSSEHVIIRHADILINDNLYNFRTGDAHVNGTFDLRTVVLHELGHFLGLQHKEGDTVMIPAIGEFSEMRAPTSTDTYDIAAKYNIALGSSGSSAIVAKSAQNSYTRSTGQKGEAIRILIELRADGECVHKEDGVVVQRHR